MNKGTRLPDPTIEAVRLWLKSIDRDHLHGPGWIEANRRFHSVTMGLRSFINQHYTDPKEQEAAYDGLTLALLSMAHFTDIAQLEESLSGLQPRKTGVKKR